MADQGFSTEDIKNMLTHLEAEYRKANISDKNYQELKKRYFISLRGERQALEKPAERVPDRAETVEEIHEDLPLDEAHEPEKKSLFKSIFGKKKEDETQRIREDLHLREIIGQIEKASTPKSETPAVPVNVSRQDYRIVKGEEYAEVETSEQEKEDYLELPDVQKEQPRREADLPKLNEEPSSIIEGDSQLERYSTFDDDYVELREETGQPKEEKAHDDEGYFEVSDSYDEKKKAPKAHAGKHAARHYKRKKTHRHVQKTQESPEMLPDQKVEDIIPSEQPPPETYEEKKSLLGYIFGKRKKEEAQAAAPLAEQPAEPKETEKKEAEQEKITEPHLEEVKKFKAEIEEAERVKAEAERLGAEMEKQEEERIKAQMEILKAEAEASREEVEKARAEAEKARVEKKQAEAEIEEAKMIKIEIEKLKAEAEKAGAEVELARAETEKARAEAEMAIAKAERAKRTLRKF